MARFLIITENSLSLQSSPIMSVNCKKLSKRNYLLLLRTLSKYLFFRRLSFHKDYITPVFINAHTLEVQIDTYLDCSRLLPMPYLSEAVYLAFLSVMRNCKPCEKRPILFNLGTYELSFFNEHYYDTTDDDVFDLPY